MSEVLIISRKHGLFCRALIQERHDCPAVFHGPIPEAAAARDAHEKALHGYHHKVPPTPGSQYAVNRRRGLGK